MNFLKRAFLYCFRKKIKTSILFLILTFLSSFLILTMAIQDASIDVTSDVKSAVDGKIRIEIDDTDKMTKSENEWGTTYTYNGDYITDDIVKAIEKVDGVVDYNSSNPQGFWGAARNFKYFSGSFDTSGFDNIGDLSSYTASLSSKKNTEFTSGKYKLESGRHIEPDDKHVVMLSKELTDYNNLKVGDTIELYNLDTDSIVKLEIIGIFSGTEGISKDAISASDIPANQGFVDYKTMNENFGREINGLPKLDIYINSPKGIDKVYEEIKNLPELEGKSLKVVMDNKEAETIENPLESFEELLSNAIIVIIAVSTIILTLILATWIRGRKREIGIYLAVGKSKVNIILQLFSEVALIAIVAFAVSYFISTMIAQGLGTYVISQFADVDTVTIAVSAEYLTQVFAIGGIIILIAVGITSYSIIRLKPRDIIAKAE
ncbi:ABC transporter permease [Breznakia pachnodae]|uniref:ABC-type antimicrobial peptide transport system permease subunit n=1 Tax=Breznakia pachnodae TaxID=265178 RepID=A0ABU0E613_9FIRM|nr:ABC transporter permease [Breznakia pachnodae]MDQ0362138.1 ABC-type antimicrobial peptide transport system permease subunit [Breznakia pachnodae]